MLWTCNIFHRRLSENALGGILGAASKDWPIGPVDMGTGQLANSQFGSVFMYLLALVIVLMNGKGVQT